MNGLDRRSPIPADCFTIGVLVGAVEGDATARFGSLGAVATHASVAVSHGLVESACGEWVDVRPTERGRDLYVRHNLAGLPSGRSYLWPASLLTDVLSELNGG